MRYFCAKQNGLLQIFNWKIFFCDVCGDREQIIRNELLRFLENNRFL